ncbi:MAG: hypothetical protein Q9174_005503 [Haloplaca sp. 1 TL-2023]
MIPPELSQKEAEFFAKARKTPTIATSASEYYPVPSERGYEEKGEDCIAEKAVREGEDRTAVKDEFLEMPEKQTEPYGQDKSKNEKGTAKASSTKNQVAKKEEQPGKEKGRTDSKGHRPRTPEQAQRKLKFISPVTEANMRANDRPYVPGHEPAYPP